jgi:hypothetical protein
VLPLMVQAGLREEFAPAEWERAKSPAHVG